MENILLSLNDNIDYTSIYNKILEHFCSVRELLKNVGITFSNENSWSDFRIHFDLKKINPNSFASKNNIDGMLFSKFKIVLLKNNNVVDGNLFNNVFTFRDILREIFKIIELNIFIDENKYDVKYITENEEHIFNIILKEFENDTTNDVIDFKKNFNILKTYVHSMLIFSQFEKNYTTKLEIMKHDFEDKQIKKKEQFLLKKTELEKHNEDIIEIIKCKLDNLKIKISKDEEFKTIEKDYIITIDNLKLNIDKYEQTYLEEEEKFKKEKLESVKKIVEEIQVLKFLKSMNKRDLVLHMVNFENILFSEVFNLIPENTTIDSKIKFLKDNYMVIITKTYNYFNDYE